MGCLGSVITGFGLLYPQRVYLPCVGLPQLFLGSWLPNGQKLDLGNDKGLTDEETIRSLLNSSVQSYKIKARWRGKRMCKQEVLIPLLPKGGEP